MTADRSRRRNVVALLAVTAVLAATGACASDDPEASDATTSPSVLQGIVREAPLQVSSVSLPDADTGAPVSMAATPGELAIVYFGYTMCPDVCPTTFSDLQRAFEMLDPSQVEAIEVRFVTVDPERDTAELMMSYLDHFVDDGVALRTLDPAELQAAEDAFLASSTITPLDDGTYDVSHSASTYVVDDRGEVVVEWPFGTLSDVMAADLRLLFQRQPTTAST